MLFNSGSRYTLVHLPKWRGEMDAIRYAIDTGLSLAITSALRLAIDACNHSGGRVVQV